MPGGIDETRLNESVLGSFFGSFFGAAIGKDIASVSVHLIASLIQILSGKALDYLARTNNQDLQKLIADAFSRSLE